MHCFLRQRSELAITPKSFSYSEHTRVSFFILYLLCGFLVPTQYYEFVNLKLHLPYISTRKMILILSCSFLFRIFYFSQPPFSLNFKPSYFLVLICFSSCLSFTSQLSPSGFFLCLQHLGSLLHF